MGLHRADWRQIDVLSQSPNFLYPTSQEYNQCMRYLVDLLEFQRNEDLTRVAKWGPGNELYPNLHRFRNGLVHDASHVNPLEIRQFIQNESQNLQNYQPLTAAVDTYPAYHTNGAVGSVGEASMRRYTNFYNANSFGGAMHPNDPRIALSDSQTVHSCYVDLNQYLGMIGQEPGLAVPHPPVAYTAAQRAAAEHIICAVCEVAGQTVALNQTDHVIGGLNHTLTAFRNRIAHSKTLPLTNHEIAQCLVDIDGVRGHVAALEQGWNQQVVNNMQIVAAHFAPPPGLGPPPPPPPPPPPAAGAAVQVVSASVVTHATHTGGTLAPTKETTASLQSTPSSHGGAPTLPPSLTHLNPPPSRALSSSISGPPEDLVQFMKDQQQVVNRTISRTGSVRSRTPSPSIAQ